VLVLAAAGCSRAQPAQVVVQSTGQWQSLSTVEFNERLDVDLTRLIKEPTTGISDLWVREVPESPPPASSGRSVARVETHFRIQCKKRLLSSIGQVEYDSTGHVLVSVGKSIDSERWSVPETGTLDAAALLEYCRDIDALHAVALAPAAASLQTPATTH
jgi:hypothetical protein